MFRLSIVVVALCLAAGLAAAQQGNPETDMFVVRSAEEPGEARAREEQAKRDAFTAQPHLAFRDPSQKEEYAVVSVLGREFPEAGGAFKPRLLVATANLDGVGDSDLVVVQKGLCSNRACDFHFLTRSDESWSTFGWIESWGHPYILPSDSGPSRIVVFGKLTDDCSSCSEPVPIIKAWVNGQFETVSVLAPNAYDRSFAVCEPFIVKNDSAGALKEMAVWRSFGNWRWLARFEGDPIELGIPRATTNGSTRPVEIHKPRPWDLIPGEGGDWLAFSSVPDDIWLEDGLVADLRAGREVSIMAEGLSVNFLLSGSAAAMSVMESACR